ncbi:zinc transporter 6, chloroplastic [Canna indica]|uniref:Zinc transporter 6, chloroplastic n=1 Tax=Canna indica TaxID=4628 RepID=A0AAQ3KYU2_9LILI|nr:zinc transporter 6, chloroplastic [Canna indica]
MSGCEAGDASRALWCRNAAAAKHLKLVSIGIILVTSAVGISSPVVLARFFEGKPAYGHALLLIKCFAAGVVLSTALVHVLPDAFAALADCQIAVRHPWRDFPFSGLLTLLGALLALLVDVVATSHAHGSSGSGGKQQYQRLEEGKQKHAPATVAAVAMTGCHGHHGGDDHNEGEEEEADQFSEEERLTKLKQRMVSQVLEIGIVFHSVIIGVTMGMSQNQCAIRPLVIALSFHQIFEGMGLGGCIAQAGFGVGTVAYMCLMFSVTTPIGIILGMIVYYMTGYDDSNPNALISEGLLGSLSAGILIYMALVDLIAVDFFHNKTMSSSPQMKKACYTALVLGSASMSVLALWA